MGFFRNVNSETVIKAAKTMSLRCLYDERVELDDRRRLNNWKAGVNDTITVKSDKNICHCTVEIPKDLLQYKADIIEWIKAGGYKCIDLSTTNITNDPILFVEWKYNYETMADANTENVGASIGEGGTGQLITD